FKDKLANEDDEIFGFFISNVGFSPSVIDEIKKSDLLIVICSENEFINLFDIVEKQYNELKKEETKRVDYLIDFIDHIEME
ncbi:5832_t:CDS:1, partial [Racocetra fulgida]